MTSEPGEPEGDDMGEPDEDATLVRRGRAARPDDEALPEEQIDAETGSTVVVRRESRRRAEQAAREFADDFDVTLAGHGVPPLPATVAGDVPGPLGRGARTPTRARREYAVNRSLPVVVARTHPPAHPLQELVDTAGADAARRRRARGRAALFLVVSCLVLGVAVALVVLLLLRG